MTQYFKIRCHRPNGLWGLAVLLPGFTAALCPAVVRAQPLTLPTFAALAQRCGSSVATLTLAAVARTESRFDPLLVADNSTHRSYGARTLEEAAATAERLIAAGDNIDVGLMQINSNNLRHLRLTVRDALDPCRSLAGAAYILTQNFLSGHGAAAPQAALRNALSMYNTGSPVKGYRNGYVGRVQAAATLLAPMILASEGGGGIGWSMYRGPPSWDVWGATLQPNASAAAEGDHSQLFVI
jgi:type IV secretion system protein VirB1